MKQYISLVRNVLENGKKTDDRTGVGTISIFGDCREYDLSVGFPAVTTKKLAWKSVVSELLWFIEGSSNERRLAELHYGKPREELSDKTTIWTKNFEEQGKSLGYERGYLGPIYGHQWRHWGEKDQLKEVIRQLKEDPSSRRIILSAWNHSDIHKMTLPPCHAFAQFKVSEGRLSCSLTQRSGDIGLGVPFNIASYSLLTHILARETGLTPDKFVHFIGDAHIYSNHVDQMKSQIEREPYPLPKLEIAEDFVLSKGLDGEFELDTVGKFRLIDYQSHETLKMDMAA